MPLSQPLKFFMTAFLEWFIVLIFFLPTAIGGWLVFFNVVSPDSMWLLSFSASFFISACLTIFSKKAAP